MTATEMKQAFLIRYDQIASNIAPPTSNAEISYFLTEAEHDLSVGYCEQYERDEVVRKKLANLIVTDFNLTPDGYTDANDIASTFYEVSTSVMKVVRERFIAASTDKCLDGKAMKVIPVRQDDVDTNYKQNPFYTPNNRKVWRLDHYDEANAKKLHQVITGDDYTPKEYGYIYLKYPTGINVDPGSLKDSDLDVSLHDEIIEKAVRYAMSATRPEQYQIAINEEKLNSDL